MATVTSITSEKAEEIHNASIVSAEMAGNNLILKNRGGSEFNLGPIKANPIDAWPIGSIFTASIATSPATLLGGGTWVRFGEGRVLVSQDGSQTEFDTALETGGEKTHVLTESEMPSHSHPTSPANVWAETASNDWQITDGTDTGFQRFTTTSTSDTGGDAAHNNLQPYIVVYMWRRTA